MLGGRYDHGGDDDYEPFAEHFLPFVTFRGIERELIISHATGPVEGIVQRARGIFDSVSDLIRPRKSKAGNSPVAFTTLSVDDFLTRYPHPTPYYSPACTSTIGRPADWSLGANFCVFCRDRLAVISALGSAPAVRVVPIRR